MLDITDIWSALDHAEEEMAQMEYLLAKRAKVGGNPQHDNKQLLHALEIEMYVDALQILMYRRDSRYKSGNATEVLVENIRRLTKDMRKWK